MKIGYVGLGQMGSAIARNLLCAGHQVTVYNRTREKAQALEKDGARIANSPADAAAGSEAVCSMLADDETVAALAFGKDGIAAGLARDTVHISQGTISLALARRLAAEHEQRRQAYLSAPVFGRPDVAEAGKLIVVVAGEEEGARHCQPLFDAIGRQTFNVGREPWQANLVKLCGNFMLAGMVEVFGEVFAVTRKAGVDHHRFLEVMNELFGSAVYQNYGAIIADEKFLPAGFPLKLGFKDMRLVLEAAQELAAPMPFASTIRDNYLAAIAAGQQEWDWASVAMVAARNAGLEIVPKGEV